jgi:hypothetical protein
MVTVPFRDRSVAGLSRLSVFGNGGSERCGAGLRGSENVIRALLEIIDGVAVIILRVVEVDNVARGRDGDGTVRRDSSVAGYRDERFR